MDTTSKLKQTARRNRVAEGLAAGDSITDIAKREGLSRQWLSEIANCPEVRQRIAQLVDSQAERVEASFTRALDVIDAAMQAKDHKNASIRFVDKDGNIRYYLRTWPDHYARLAGVKRLQDLLTAGRPPAKPVEAQKDRLFTLEEIAQAIAKRNPK